jgi:hypothetical protein
MPFQVTQKLLNVSNALLETLFLTVGFSATEGLGLWVFSVSKFFLVIGSVSVVSTVFIDIMVLVASSIHFFCEDGEKHQYAGYFEKNLHCKSCFLQQ